MTSNDIVNKIDQLLKEDKNFDTRAGLRFLMEIIKDAFEFIDSQKKSQTDTNDKLKSFETRINHVEKGLFDFLEARKTEQIKAEDERKWWRRTIIGAAITTAISQVVILIILFLQNKP